MPVYHSYGRGCGDKERSRGVIPFAELRVMQVSSLLHNHLSQAKLYKNYTTYPGILA